MKNRLKLILFVVFAVMLSACSSTKKMSVPDPLKSLDAPEGKALLYIVRPNYVGAAINFKVSIDGEYIGLTKGKNYIYTYVAPGKHTILSKAENKEELDLLFEEGQTYYIEQVPKMGMIKARNKLIKLNVDEGVEKLNKCRLTKDYSIK
jgi:hypothetical protein